MVKGILIVSGIERNRKGITAASYSKFYRKLYGYINSPSYGKYHFRIPGFLDGVMHIKYANGVIVVGSKNGNRMKRSLKSNRAKVHSQSIELSARVAEALADHKSED
jgi:hypothetical protein